MGFYKQAVFRYENIQKLALLAVKLAFIFTAFSLNCSEECKGITPLN